MNGLKSRGIFSLVKSWIGGEKVVNPEAREVIPGVKAGSPHLRNVAVYHAKPGRVFYMDGVVFTEDGSNVRLTDTQTGTSVTVSMAAFEYLFQRKEK